MLQPSAAVEPPGSDADQAFFDSNFGVHSGRRTWRDRRLGRATDFLFDARLRLQSRQLKAARLALPVRRVLVTSVEVPGREADLQGVVDRLRRTRHDVSLAMAPMGERGKFHNINLALAKSDLAAVDWLIVTDDDVDLPDDFLDTLLAVGEHAKLKLSMPAHRFRSHSTFLITQRVWGSLVRQTNFVEIGPLTVIRREGFEALVPFPPSRWAYGIDLLWAEICRRRGWRMGVVDAVPITHLKPVGGSYSADEAIKEGRDLLERFDVRMTRAELLAPGRELIARS